jgi:hypothetical protein
MIAASLSTADPIDFISEWAGSTTNVYGITFGGAAIAIMIGVGALPI